MYSNHTCPRCAHPISFDRMLGNTVVCSCGWSGNKSHFEGKKRNFHLKKIGAAVAIAGAVYVGVLIKDWGKHFPELLYYKTISSLKMTSAKDEARMAFVCKSMKKHKCAARAYTKAFAKSPKSYKLAGALASELVRIKEYDKAILTFQNFFSHEDGSDEQKMLFARALSNKEYTADATEWYYKSLQANSKNFDAAKELVSHLVKAEQFPEALSVIGHYNMMYPKTIKEWDKFSDEVKAKYSAYTSQYSIKEMKISGLNNFVHAPVKFSANGETQMFMVDPESDNLTVDLKTIQEWGIAFKTVGEKEITATNGRFLKGTEIIFPELHVGTFRLENVKALACEECAFLLGRDVMKSLNFQAADSKGVKYITLRQ